MHFSTMVHRRKNSLIDAFYPFITSQHKKKTFIWGGGVNPPGPLRSLNILIDFHLNLFLFHGWQSFNSFLQTENLKYIFTSVDISQKINKKCLFIYFLRWLFFNFMNFSMVLKAFFKSFDMLFSDLKNSYYVERYI